MRLNELSRRAMSMAAFALLCGAIPGCCCGNDEKVEAEAPPCEEPPKHSAVVEYGVYHNDQGMLADMSIADIHFIPHTTELNGTGEARLQRYSELLATRGGTLYYDTRITDKPMLDGRIAAAKAYLADMIPSAKPIEVVLGLPGGPGMTGKEGMDASAVAEQAEKRGTAYQLTGSAAMQTNSN